MLGLRERSVLSFLIAALAVGTGCAPAPIECDVEKVDCRERTFESVAEFLGAPGSERPPARVLTEEQFSSELREDPELEGDENTNRWLRLLGFLRADTELVDFHQALIGFNGEGHYDPDTDIIVIVNRPERAFGQLVRRYIMAVTHQQYGLAANERGVSLDDESLAKRAVLEGYAYLQLGLWYGAQYGSARENFDVASRRNQLSQIHQDIITDPNTQPLTAVWYFPYAVGYDWMADDCLLEDPVCFERLREPPESARLDPLPGTPSGSTPSPDREQPPFAHPAPPEGFEEVDTRQLGWWWLEVFLIRSVTAPPAGERANGSSGLATQSLWVGDRFSVYRRDSDMVVVWRVRATEEGGSSLISGLVDRVNGSENQHWFAEADGRDAMIVVAESESALEAWRTSTPQ